MITEFIKGKYYRYNGNQQVGWNSDMTFMLDGKFHKCMNGDENCAAFKDDIGDVEPWCWGNLENFTEITDMKNVNWKEFFEK